ncbi:MAG TPA: helix-turn-helix transcriptional regulator [Acidimicrobiales bacterium]|nr:helix-turn-helix transcriptional regulator [Acidimicrobiales bacterium]
MSDSTISTGPMNRHSRFDLAPLRRFLFPAVLLLLSEKPGYGYSLVKELQTFRFGPVDRPSVYRALAQLETDGLVESSPEKPTAGRERRVYRLTGYGERILRAWMGVIKEERDHLDSILRRYRATGTADAVMADVEGGWAAVLNPAGSAVSPTFPIHRPLLRSLDATRSFALIDSIGPRHQFTAPPAESTGPPEEVGAPAGDSVARVRSRARGRGVPTAVGDVGAVDGAPDHFVVVPDRSVMLVEVRSSVGPISFGAIGITGWVRATVRDGAIDAAAEPAAHLEIAVDGLRCGNSLYDAELLRRIDARRFSVASIDLRETTPIAGDSRFLLTGELTFHGVTRSTQGTVALAMPSDHKLVVTGEQVFDIRDFAVESPTVLMLRIYPDVRVRLHVEAERDG